MKAPFIYFFESTGTIPEEYESRFEKGGFSVQTLVPGPSGTGLMVSPYVAVQCIYAPREQHWEKIGKGAWLGTAKDVNPDQFLRKETYSGYEVTLADGKKWSIPIANPSVQTFTLPRIFRWKWCDKLQKRIMYNAIENRFKEVSDKALEIGLDVYNKGLDSALNGSEIEFSFDMSDEEAALFLHKVISINYDINFLEFQALGVFSTESFQLMFNCLIDADGIFEAIKESINEATQEAVLSKKNSVNCAGKNTSTIEQDPQLQTSFFS